MLASSSASLDEKVYSVIGAGKVRRALALLNYLKAENEELKELTARELDKSLQRLRRAERIKFNSKLGWTLTDFPP